MVRTKEVKRAKKVMHGDDNLQHIKLVKEILEKEGYKVVSVKSGAECLARFKKEKPDLVLLDILMPDMNGLEVFYRLKKSDNTAVIAFLTVTGSSEKDIARLKKGGVVDYIVKPFTPAELIKRVKAILQ